MIYFMRFKSIDDQNVVNIIENELTLHTVKLAVDIMCCSRNTGAQLLTTIKNNYKITIVY